MSENRITGQPRIFPRNLTARASTMVLGNPANARPESGVDNCHPGLEFDQRNIDQVFFPGLRFEFQFLLGARLVDIDKALGPDLQDTDVQQDLYLWYLHGCFGAAPGTSQLVSLVGLDGYEALRRVRDLEAGDLTVVIGQTPDITNAAQVAAWGDDGMKLARDIIAATNPGGPAPTPRIVRDGAGVLLGAAVAGKRAAYLDDDGVISLGAIKAGDLTRSLCAPWQWDFADCGCHYWASNKPDLVMGSEEGASQTLNFQRNRQPSAEPAKASDVKIGLYDRWTDTFKTITQPEVVRSWQTLPVVVGERETSQTDPVAPPTHTNLLSPKEVAQQLTILATIEHALCVEYLYAHYSIAAPERRPAAGDTSLFDAAHQILTIAIDEMRHFQWANEALILLGAPVALGRATTYGQAGKKQFQGSFKPGPLTAERLNAFIEIEAPSKTFGNGTTLDGYYTHILASVAGWDDAVAPVNRRALIAVIKLIIDEGHEHFQRFNHVKALLRDRKEEDYLRVRDARPAPKTGEDPAETPEEAAKKKEDEELRNLADSYYHTLLAGLGLAFAMGEDTRNALLKQARRSMHNLHEVGHKLAARGIGLPFNLPPVSQSEDVCKLEESRAGSKQPENAYPAALLNRIDHLRLQSDALLGKLASSSDHAIQALAKRHRKTFHAAVAAPTMTPERHR